MKDRKKFVPKMDNYDHLEQLIEEAWMYLIVHDSYVECDERLGWSIIDPMGCWRLAPPTWSKGLVEEVAAVFLYLWFQGSPPPMAEELAWRAVESYRKSREKNGGKPLIEYI